MKEIRFFYVPDASVRTELPEEEAQHATRVLRLREGDELYLMDGKGAFYSAVVTLASNKRCMYEIKESMPQERAWKGHLHVAVAPTKMMERLEWFCEKATEVGVDEYSFLNCKFSERKVLKIPRIEKIVVSAVKQSHKPWMPLVNELCQFEDFIKEPRNGRKFIAHCYQEIARKDFFTEISKDSDGDITVLIGPEGDFSIDEVRMAMEYGFEPVTLGTSRLRTETAALSSAVMMNLARRK